MIKRCAGSFNVFICQPLGVVYDDEREADLYILKYNGGKIVEIKNAKKILSSLHEFYDNVDDEFVEEYNYNIHEQYIKQTNTTIKPQKKLGYIYLIESGGYHKIGVSKNPLKRISQLMTIPPFNAEIIDQVYSDDIYKLEERMHNYFCEQRTNGEWFDLSDNDVLEIKKWFNFIRSS